MVEDCIASLSKLISHMPGLGPKSARRIVSFILKSDEKYTADLIRLITDAKEKIHPCSVCGMWTEDEICPICSDPDRERDRILIVENSDDILSIESCKIYDGLYHVLGGRISPITGVYPENLNIDKLKERIDEKTTELIIATNPNEEGDITAEYIKKMFVSRGIKISRLASGIQSGSNIEFASQRAIISSIINRKDC